MNYFRMPIRLLSNIPSNKTIVWGHIAFLKNQWIKGLFGFVVVFGLISQISNHVSLVYSRTNSLPYRLFINLKQVAPQRGHYTSFNSHWYGGRVIKKVVGIEGDILSYDNKGNLWVDTVWRVGQKVGKHKKHAKDGRLLTPIKPGVIPKGKVFVLGEHERSFDSRYEELGLISEKDLLGRLVALV